MKDTATSGAVRGTSRWPSRSRQPCSPWLPAAARHRRVEFCDHPAAASLARGWLVPTLVGVTVRASVGAAVGAAIEALLAERLPVARWELDPHFVAVLSKHGCIHASAAAPPDITTDQPMDLQLFAEQRRPYAGVGGWLDARRRLSGLSLPAGPFEFEIEVATYSNMHALGVGMPSYS